MFISMQLQIVGYYSYSNNKRLVAKRDAPLSMFLTFLIKSYERIAALESISFCFFFLFPDRNGFSSGPLKLINYLKTHQTKTAKTKELLCEFTYTKVDHAERWAVVETEKQRRKSQGYKSGRTQWPFPGDSIRIPQLEVTSKTPHQYNFLYATKKK